MSTSPSSTNPGELFSVDRLRAEFDRGLSFTDYISKGTDHQRNAWMDIHRRSSVDDSQRSLLAGFVREINILAISGIWCGDCVQQLPFLEGFREANPGKINLRFIDRDAHAEFTDPITICSGNRVPVVIFMNEDFDFVSLFGDRTLTRYRAMAARQLGASCPIPGAEIPQDELEATRQDWLNELERVHLLCRLSTKLRGRYHD